MPATMPMTPQVFAIFSALVEERTGLHYDLDHLDVLAEKASVRALERGFDSLLDYYYHLRYDDPDGEETLLLAEDLVVPETYLFREQDQLDAVVKGELAPAARAGRRLRVWCAASSTGEEPYTLAMLLERQGVLDAVDLVATDLSRRSLERARSGRLGRRSVRDNADPGLVARWVDTSGEVPRLRAPLPERIVWRQLNLLDGPGVAAMGRFDAIILRNVLIYFTDDTVRKVVAGLSERLEPGGVLLVGVSESLMRIAPYLVAEEMGGAFLYRKSE